MENILETVITIKQDLFTNPYKITINWGNYIVGLSGLRIIKKGGLN